MLFAFIEALLEGVNIESKIGATILNVVVVPEADRIHPCQPAGKVEDEAERVLKFWEYGIDCAEGFVWAKRKLILRNKQINKNTFKYAE